MADATLLTAITGIVISGVVGPQVTGGVTRANERGRFEREQVVKQRDDLRQLIDEAAELLAPGGTNVRLIWEAQKPGGPPLSPEVNEWSSRVYVIEQRLRLRLAGVDDVVQRYEAVRAQLVVAAEARSPEDALDEFEQRRAAFLDVSRAEMQRSSVTIASQRRGRIGGP